MLAHVLVVLAALAASPKPDPRLVGTWISKDKEVEVATLYADGTGHMQDEEIRWSTRRGRVKVLDLDGNGGEAPYRLDGDVLTVVVKGTAYQLTRAPEKAAEPEKPKPAKAPGTRPLSRPKARGPRAEAPAPEAAR